MSVAAPRLRYVNGTAALDACAHSPTFVCHRVCVCMQRVPPVIQGHGMGVGIGTLAHNTEQARRDMVPASNRALITHNGATSGDHGHGSGSGSGDNGHGQLVPDATAPPRSLRDFAWMDARGEGGTGDVRLVVVVGAAVAASAADSHRV